MKQPIREQDFGSGICDFISETGISEEIEIGALLEERHKALDLTYRWIIRNGRQKEWSKTTPNLTWSSLHGVVDCWF